jgi:hypothetical protein
MMQARLKDLLSEKELKQSRVYQVDENTFISQLTVRQLNGLFMVLDDFKNLATGYIISSKVLEILIKRAIDKDWDIF